MAISKIRVGIIGAGRMGVTHYSIINTHPDVEVVAIADTSLVVKSLIQKYLGVETYANYNDLINQARPDALLLCTPPFLNYEILKEAAKFGIHCFVEKPYTLSYSHGIEIAEIFEKAKLVNQVGYVNRFNDVFSTVKKLIVSGILGEVISFRTEMFSRTITKQEDSENWRSSHANGGGAVYEMASHSIDLIQYIIGEPGKVMSAGLTKVFSRNVEDIVTCSFSFNNGINGLLYVNWSDESYRKPTNKIEVFGKKGKIIADQHGYKIYVKEENNELGYHKGWNSRYITDVFSNVPFYLRGNEFTSQLYDFINCISSGKSETRCSFREASSTLKIIDDIFTANKR